MKCENHFDVKSRSIEAQWISRSHRTMKESRGFDEDTSLNTEAQRAQRDVFDFTNQPFPSVEIGLNALPALVPRCVSVSLCLCVSNPYWVSVKWTSSAQPLDSGPETKDAIRCEFHFAGVR